MELYKEFIQKLINSGLLCDEYVKKLDDTYYGKAGMFNLLCDSNGFNYLQELQLKGVDIPYGYIMKFFSRYVNGQYVAEYTNENGRVLYDSVMYCCYKGAIIANTSLVSVLNCTCEINIPPRSSVQIAIDTKSNVNIISDKTSSVRCFVYGNGSITSERTDSMFKINKINGNK